MSTDTILKDSPDSVATEKETINSQTSSTELSEKQDSSTVEAQSDSSVESSKLTDTTITAGESETTEESLSSKDSEYNQKLLASLEAKVKEAHEDLIQFEQRNNYNINSTTLLQVKKRKCLLESDHENLNFLFEYMVYLNKRKKNICSK